jgi:OmpA-OmpF porin, OOP family
MQHASTIRNRSWYQRPRVGLVCLAALLASEVRAGDPGGLYLGAGYGHNSGDTTVLRQSGSQVIETSVHSSEPAWRLSGGYRWPYVALEGGYRDLGTTEATVEGSAFVLGYRGWDVSVLGLVPLGRFELLGRLGRFFYERRMEVDHVDHGAYRSDTTLIGLGVAMRWPRFALRLEWERSGVLDPQVEHGMFDFVSMITLGVTVNL